MLIDLVNFGACEIAPSLVSLTNFGPEPAIVAAAEQSSEKLAVPAPGMTKFFLLTTRREQEGPAAKMPADDELLPVLYNEPHRPAAALTSRLSPGQTLEPTALVINQALAILKTRRMKG